MTAHDETLERCRRARDQHAATVVELTARYEALVEELSLVRRAGDGLGALRDLQAVCGFAVDLLQDAVAPEHCSVMLLDHDGALVLAAARGAFDAEAQTFEIAAQAPVLAAGVGIAGVVVQRKQPIRIDDATVDRRFHHDPSAKVKPISLLCLPLAARDRVLGVINLSDSVPGAFDVGHERLLALIANAIAMAVENAALFSDLRQSRARLAQENQSLRAALDERFGFEGLVGGSPAFRRVMHLMAKVADTVASVLITGESGTGKELVARTLHHNSRRRDAPFVALNCAALPESLLEAELFGIERGVATGVDARPGTFEQASGGTLFLDEIGDMAPGVQAKVLRVLQERRLTRVGGRASIEVDVRVLAATHRDLSVEIAAGRFRQDLFYRLKVVTVRIPPLRARREDILPLAQHFMARFATRHDRAERRFSRRAAQAMLAYGWPGNVRELEHAVEQAVLLSEGSEVEPDDLDLEAAQLQATDTVVQIPDGVLDFHQTMAEVQETAERLLIVRALKASAGNRTRAAQSLGLARRTLLYKLKRLGLD